MLTSNEGKKRQRYPVNPQVRRALVTMLHKKGFSEEYVAASIGRKFDGWTLAYEPALKRLVKDLDDEQYRKGQVLRWLELLKEEKESAGPNEIVALIDQEIKRLHQ